MVELLALAHDRGCEAELADQLQLGLDAARLSLQLNELRLPAIKVLWPQFAEQADKEGWPAARLPAGKTIDGFDFNAVPRHEPGGYEDDGAAATAPFRSIGEA